MKFEKRGRGTGFTQVDTFAFFEQKEKIQYMCREGLGMVGHGLRNNTLAENCN